MPEPMTQTELADGYTTESLIEWLYREASRKEQEGLYTHHRRLIAAAQRLAENERLRKENADLHAEDVVYVRQLASRLFPKEAQCQKG